MEGNHNNINPSQEPGVQPPSIRQSMHRHRHWLRCGGVYLYNTRDPHLRLATSAPRLPGSVPLNTRSQPTNPPRNDGQDQRGLDLTPDNCRLPPMSAIPQLEDSPREVAELAARMVAYVESSEGIALEFDSETLPILDHYLKGVADASAETSELIAVCAGAYFGEVVRRCIGGQWQTAAAEAIKWRLVLPGGMWFLPAHVVLATIHQSDDYNDNLNPPAKMVKTASGILARMGDVNASDYYSLCGRFDTLEHLQAVLLAIAAEAAKAVDAAEDDADCRNDDAN